MNRPFFLVLTCVLILSTALGEDTNLVKNGDFSKISSYGFPDGWYRYKDESAAPGSCAQDAEAGIPSAYRIRNSSETVVQQIRISPGKMYRASYRLKTNFPKWKSTASFQVLWCGKDRKPLFNPTDRKAWHMEIKNTQGTRDWHTGELDCLAPPEAEFAEIRLLIAFDNAGTAWFSDITLREVPPADAFQNRVGQIPLLPTKEDVAQRFLDPALWQHASGIRDFLTPTANTTAHNPTRAELFYDDNALYVRVTCSWSPGETGEIAAPGINFAQQESCEIFLAPPGMPHQFQILGTAAGELYCFTERWGDGWPMKTHDWKNNGISHRIERQNDVWTLALRIPFASLPVATPKDGERWGVNICRSAYSRNGAELSAWSALREAHFQFPGDFGQMVFTRNRPVLKDVNLSADSAILTVHNPEIRPVQLEASYVRHGFRFGRTRVELAAGETQRIELPGSQLPRENALRFVELRNADILIAKHAGALSNEYYALGQFDPENVRGPVRYLAADHPFFLAFTFRHNDPTGLGLAKRIGRDKKAFDLIFDAPEGLEFTSMAMDVPDWDPIAVKAAREGRTNRYRFQLPAILNYPEPSFVFFYRCSIPPDKDVILKYRLEQNGRQLPESEITCRTMNIGRVRRSPERWGHDMFYLTPKIIRQWFPAHTAQGYLNLGMNRISLRIEPMKSSTFFQGQSPRTSEEFNDLLIQDMKASGRPFFLASNSNSATPKAWHFTRSDKNARAFLADGKDAPFDLTRNYSLCPSYRGKYFQEHMKNILNSSLFRKYGCTWLALDIELWASSIWNQICFCDRCVREFMAEEPEFSGTDIRKTFLADNNQQFLNRWKLFRERQQKRFFHDLTAPIKELAGSLPSTSPRSSFTVSEWRYPSTTLAPLVDYFELGLYYTPEVVWQKYEGLYRQWGDDRKNLYATYTFGQTNQCPDFHMTPKHVKELIFEAAAYGAQGICWYYYNYLEPRRMKAIIDGLNAVLPYESIIVDGRISQEAATDNPSLLLTHRRLREERLLAIRTYGSKESQTGEIKLTGISNPTSIFDCETGEKIADLSATRPEFNISVPGDSCKLLFIGTEQQFTQRQIPARGH